MRRLLRLYWGWFLAGVVWAVVALGLVLALYTRTDWGRARVLTLTLKTLGGRLNGVPEVQRMEGNVFTGARLHRVTLRDPNGVVLLQADSAFIEYRLSTFVGGDVVIQDLVLFQPRLNLVLLPGDSLWNYQWVLRDPTPNPLAPRRATLIEQLRVLDGHVTVRMPWAPDSTLAPAARERQVRQALTDTSRLVVERVSGGLLRTMLFDVEDATLSELLIAPDERGGTSLRVDTAVGLAWLYRDPPLRVRDLRGVLALQNGLLSYHAPHIVLPDSRLESVGTVEVRTDRYDVVVAGEQVAFADMHWLYPRFPEEGGGAIRLHIETRPEGLLLLGRDVDVRTPGSRVRGRFGLVLGDTLRFVDTDLQADPLDVRTVESLLPGGLPVRGLRVGALEVRGPAS